MRRTVLLTAALLAIPATAQGQPPLNQRDLNTAARYYVHRAWHETKYTAKCHPRYELTCLIRMKPHGCDCDSLTVAVSVQLTRGGLLIVGPFEGERYMLHARPL